MITLVVGVCTIIRFTHESLFGPDRLLRSDVEIRKRWRSDRPNASGLRGLADRFRAQCIVIVKEHTLYQKAIGGDPI